MVMTRIMRVFEPLSGNCILAASDLKPLFIQGRHRSAGKSLRHPLVHRYAAAAGFVFLQGEGEHEHDRGSDCQNPVGVDVR